MNPEQVAPLDIHLLKFLCPSFISTHPIVMILATLQVPTVCIYFKPQTSGPKFRVAFLSSLLLFCVVFFYKFFFFSWLLLSFSFSYFLSFFISNSSIMVPKKLAIYSLRPIGLLFSPLLPLPPLSLLKHHDSIYTSFIASSFLFSPLNQKKKSCPSWRVLYKVLDNLALWIKKIFYFLYYFFKTFSIYTHTKIPYNSCIQIFFYFQIFIYLVAFFFYIIRSYFYFLVLSLRLEGFFFFILSYTQCAVLLLFIFNVSMWMILV